MDEHIDDDDEVDCLCDECVDLWVDVFVAGVALDDAVNAAIAQMERQFP